MTNNHSVCYIGEHINDSCNYLFVHLTRTTYRLAVCFITSIDARVVGSIFRETEAMGKLKEERSWYLALMAQSLWRLWLMSRLCHMGDRLEHGDPLELHSSRWSSQPLSSWAWRTTTAAVAVATRAVGSALRWAARKLGLLWKVPEWVKRKENKT